MKTSKVLTEAIQVKNFAVIDAEILGDPAQNRKEDVVKKYWKFACDRAVEYDRPDVLIYLISMDKEKKFIHMQEDWLCRIVAEKGYTDVFNLLLNETPDPQERSKMIYSNKNWPFKMAVSGGHAAIVQSIIELTPTKCAKEREEMLPDGGSDILRSAIKSNQIDVIKSVVGIIREEGKIKENKQKLLRIMIDVNGDADIGCRIAGSLFDEAQSKQLADLLCAVKKEKIKEVQFAADHLPQNVVDVLGEECGLVAKRGALEVVKYLFDLVSDPKLRYDMMVSTSSFAAQNGNSEMLEYVISLTPEQDQDNIMQTACINAAMSGHAEMLKDLLSRVRAELLNEMLKLALTEVAQVGHEEMLKDLLSQINEEDRLEAICSAFITVASSGNIAVLRTLLSMMDGYQDQEQIEIQQDQIEFAISNAFAAAAGSGKLEVLQILESRILLEEDPEAIFNAFTCAIEAGDDVVANYLISLIEGDQNMINDFSEYVAGDWSNLEIMKRLISIEDQGQQNCEQHHEDRICHLFGIAARSCRLEMLEYLLSQIQNPARRTAQIANVFESAEEPVQEFLTIILGEEVPQELRIVSDKISKLTKFRESIILRFDELGLDQLKNEKKQLDAEAVQKLHDDSVEYANVIIAMFNVKELTAITNTGHVLEAIKNKSPADFNFISLPINRSLNYCGGLSDAHLKILNEEVKKLTLSPYCKPSKSPESVGAEQLDEGRQSVKVQIS